MTDLLGTGCNPGSYKSGANSCKPCEQGTWSGAGETICHECPAGQYTSNRLSCRDCPAGKCSDKKSYQCKSCGVGQVSDRKSSVCTTCPAGTYASHSDNKCKPCSKGTYSSQDSVDSCTLCPAGSYSGSGQKECRPCSTGQHFNLKLSTCVDCMPSFYSSNPQNPCRKCSRGKYSAAKEGSCHACPAGSKANAGQTGCNPVPTRCPTPAPTRSPEYMIIVDCAPSFYRYDYIKDGRTYQGCKKCEPGTYTSDFSTVCYTCPQGQTVNAGQTGCIPAVEPTPEPTLSPTEYMIIVDCAPSYYRYDYVKDGRTYQGCRKCEPRTYTSGSTTRCSRCPPGRTVNAEQTGCIPAVEPTPEPTPAPTLSPTEYNMIWVDCSPSFYRYDYIKDGNPYQGCKKCEPGTYTSGFSTVCYTCPQGQTVNAEQTGCIPAEEPTYQPSRSPQIIMVDCAPSYYLYTYIKDGRTKQGCKKCEPGTYTSDFATACSTCPAGQTVNAEQTGCIPAEEPISGPTISPTGITLAHCTASYYRTYQGCKKCAPGTYSSGFATSCSTCPAGQTVNAEQTGCIKPTPEPTHEPTHKPTHEPTYEPTHNPTPTDDITCPPSYYKILYTSNGKNYHKCLKCDAGTYSSSVTNGCTSCDIGQTVNPEQTGCIQL